jgi:hypothetical protein
MNIYTLYGFILPYFRRKRMRIFEEIFHPDQKTTILDVGGGLMNWILIGCRSRITILNIKLPMNKKTAPENYDFVEGDGTALAYPGNSFDLVYSNSVIEHVGSSEKQKRFASEVSRVSRKLWIQTPARWFFLEPHFIAPFIHYLPKGWQKRLVRWFSIWGLLTRPNQQAVNDLVDEIRLLTYKEMKSLFPDCEIRKEKFLFMTKSYIAVRK